MGTGTRVIRHVSHVGPRLTHALLLRLSQPALNACEGIAWRSWIDEVVLQSLASWHTRRRFVVDPHVLNLKSSIVCSTS